MSPENLENTSNFEDWGLTLVACIKKIKNIKRNKTTTTKKNNRKKVIEIMESALNSGAVNEAQNITIINDQRKIGMPLPLL